MDTITSFLKKESSAGILLIIVTVLALILQNSFLSAAYTSFLHTPVEIRFGALHIAKPLLLWVNDGLMAIFFFLIGLEVKREVMEGHLSSLKQITLPGIAAVGGMIVPALIFILFNKGESFAMNGWAIPTATDIAFALGILSLLGPRVPLSLKIFLMALSIIDDLGAIVIIALFYTTDLSTLSITVAAISLAILFIMNRMDVAIKSAYIVIGIILWVSVLKSGVHATLAGVALAFMIPMESKNKKGNRFSMAKEMEHDLHYWVAFLILPLFAFVNAGVDLKGISLEAMSGPVPLGVMLGLFVGKQAGVFGFSWLAIKMGMASLPKESSWMMLYGVSVLTGIGFTMSLFVDSLAYDDTQIYHYADKLAILLGSFLSAATGYLILRMQKNKNVES
ncbi:Na+/H+ antiporter NhaA [Sulfurovum sp. NBC37-1]|uniref:Na(+)/H(+) antiporter NhaA n=1 Tax=Sulfurovum sp. (strain NBC37-1) TaxID=387093 RepID=NHAA_SULNB|nr:Na+/H+ antiporter NhaA [Sulfurovum sp. NBC37-1]A6Q6G8.1 RecName: Full=Na(+)/H(+) antiporter NhaA; AltName: Full=Sodium/proton antiporter NhaA [Sulfurovum sp. NBC37-1]BAF71077.1 Na+:H+ antiporter, NhaA family [Sulfurovum sp. NBC37-1]